MIANVVVGKPICEPWHMFSHTKEEWENSDKKETLFTDERFLPRIMVEAGLVKSVNEVRKNKPELLQTLDTIDFREIKWGKKRLFIQIGE